ncbi:hypothetical protein [Micromonospora echinofusca]|nr:hypothetical protein [Micromonospora echinofusca]
MAPAAVHRRGHGAMYALAHGLLAVFRLRTVRPGLACRMGRTG